MGRIGDNDEEGDMDRVIWMETVVADVNVDGDLA